MMWDFYWWKTNNFNAYILCSKILTKRQTALNHYNCINQSDSIIQCSRLGCSEWVLKFVLNCHMNQKHEIDKIFFKVFKRSFLPDASENPAEKEKVQKTSFDNDTASVAHESPLDQYDHKSNIKLDQVTPLDLNINQEQQQ